VNELTSLFNNAELAFAAYADLQVGRTDNDVEQNREQNRGQTTVLVPPSEPESQGNQGLPRFL
jgi:hypothetical protein